MSCIWILGLRNVRTTVLKMAHVIWGNGCVKSSFGDEEHWWCVIPHEEWYQKNNGFQSIGTLCTVRWLPWMPKGSSLTHLEDPWGVIENEPQSHLQSVVRRDIQARRNNNPVKDLHILSSISLSRPIFHFISLSPVAKRSLSMVFDKGALNTLYCYFKLHHN